MQSKILLQLKDLSYKYPSGEDLFTNINLSVTSGDKIALVGHNGAGKSTLLKIISGEIQLPSGCGSITKDAALSYVEQINLSHNVSHRTLYTYLSTKHEEWWNVLLKLEELFNTTLDSEMEMRALSGGELMKVNLAMAMVHDPDILLLDEPTNHLDIQSIETLVGFLKRFKGAYIIISHDIFFLDRVADKVWEIDDKAINIYGGNYTEYKKQKQLIIDAKKRRFQDAQEKLKHITQLEDKDRERSARSAKTLRTSFLKGSMTGYEYVGGEKGKAAPSSAQQKKIKNLRKDAEEASTENQVSVRKMAFVSLKNVEEKSARTLINLIKADIYVKDILLIHEADLNIRYGERFSLGGNNGSGKSSLIKAILLKEPQIKLVGDLYLNDNMSSVYIDQNYKLINPELNLIENIISYNISLSDADAKQMLGKLQFKSDAEMTRKASALSGGELSRLSIAMTTSSSLDMIILDEPTNNLDVQTVDILINALNNFSGALIVISHNIDFLSKINISKSFYINKKQLKTMYNIPKDREDYLQEIVEFTK